MYVLNHPGNGLMFMQDAIDPEAPYSRASQRRQQHSAHGVSKRVAIAALQRLYPELSDIGIVGPREFFNYLRSDQSTNVDCFGHL
jgi:hypothetical protein